MYPQNNNKKGKRDPFSKKKTEKISKIKYITYIAQRAKEK
jgi:hypothetical protein